MEDTDGLYKKCDIRNRWEVLEGRKGSLHSRNEKYARWTLPYLYPKIGSKNTELDTDLDSVGARAVNHLSNKLTTTLFPAYRPFLRLEIADDLKASFEKKRIPLEEIDKALAKGEKKAVRLLDKLGHRTAATEAAKFLIVTGNALMYYPDKERAKAQVYSTRDYCVVRDLSGVVLEIITRDMKAFETFTEAVQIKLKELSKDRKYEDNSNVSLYTHVRLEDDGKYKVRQAADDIELPMVADAAYAKKDLPWVPLTWNLVRGEDYGRGMVEDYRGAFGLIEVLTQALVEGVIVAAEVKFLVNPASVLDVEAMNKARNGSYHSGRDGDVIAIKSDKHLDFEQVRKVLEDYIRQIGQAFLLDSAVTRDAERVTAEEIRYQANELETAYGGVYSRFTADWQEPLAQLLCSRMDVTISDQTIYPIIVTGLDTLSRLGDIDNYRMFMEDVSVVNNIPEAMHKWINFGGLLAFAGTNRGLDYSKFIYSAAQVQANDQQAMAAQKQMMDHETGNKVIESAGSEFAKQDTE